MFLFKEDNSTGNVDFNQIDGNDVKQDFDVDDFFNSLDKSVDGAIFDDGATPDVKEDSGAESEPAQQDEVTELRKELETYKKRYGDSSREAKRLYEENKELANYKEYVPLLKVMQDDPGVVNIVRDYLEGNIAPKSIRDELELPEDFIFDGDEAVSDPNSDSYKVMESMIGRMMQKQMRNSTPRPQPAEQHTNDVESSLNGFREKMKWSDDELSEFVEFAKNKTLTLEDIYYLKTRESRDREIVRKSNEEKEKQLKKMRQTSPSLSSVGGESSGSTEEDEIFKMMKGINSGMNVFGS